LASLSLLMFCAIIGCLYSICSRSVGFADVGLVMAPFARFLIVWMVGVGFVARITQSVLPRGIVVFGRFLGERVFGLHFTDLVIGSERDSLLLGLPSRLVSLSSASRRIVFNVVLS